MRVKAVSPPRRGVRSINPASTSCRSQRLIVPSLTASHSVIHATPAQQ